MTPVFSKLTFSQLTKTCKAKQAYQGLAGEQRALNRQATPYSHKKSVPVATIRVMKLDDAEAACISIRLLAVFRSFT